MVTARADEKAYAVPRACVSVTLLRGPHTTMPRALAAPAFTERREWHDAWRDARRRSNGACGRQSGSQKGSRPANSVSLKRMGRWPA